MKNNNQTEDLIVIGGGIMGLMTAYFASNFVKKITILEKYTIGKENKDASSFSYTRSIRSDYPDPFYTQLAYEAQVLWRKMQEKSKEKFYVDCGCLNIAKATVTPDISKTYAGESYETRFLLKLETIKMDKYALKKRFPQFDADFGSLEETGAYILQQTVKDFLLKELKQKNVIIKENVAIVAIEENENKVIIKTQKETIIGEKVVISAGRFINDVIKLLKGNKLQFSLTPTRPKENKYIYPPKKLVKKFLPENFPVFAYLDAGIYGHPIFDIKKGAVKIGYYQSPEIKEERQNKITSVNDFINECLPLLKNAPTEDVTDVDQC